MNKKFNKYKFWLLKFAIKFSSKNIEIKDTINPIPIISINKEKKINNNKMKKENFCFLSSISQLNFINFKTDDLENNCIINIIKTYINNTLTNMTN